jgi:hypothetical protein
MTLVVHLESGSCLFPIPDPGVIKAPAPGCWIRNTASFSHFLFFTLPFSVMTTVLGMVH